MFQNAFSTFRYRAFIKESYNHGPNLINYRGYTEHSNSNLSYLGILRRGVKLGFSILIKAWKAEQ